MNKTDRVIELNFHWPNLEPMVRAPYSVVFADGTKINGALDDKGYAKIENAPDGDWEVCFGEDARRARIDFEYPPFVDENGKEIV
jgi:type VI secretion system secreted protein VgrG